MILLLNHTLTYVENKNKNKTTLTYRINVHLGKIVLKCKHRDATRDIGSGHCHTMCHIETNCMSQVLH